MRVTDKMTFERSSAAIAAAQEKLAAASDQVSSGRRVVHPWDDPAAAMQLSISQAAQRRLSGWMTAADRAIDELNMVDGVVDGVQNALSRARELAVQLANGTYNATDRANGAKEVDGLKQFIISQLNTEAGGRYLLGGRADGAPPFNAAGNYNGDAGVRQVEVGPNTVVDTSVRADVAFKGTAGGVDILATLDALSTALTTNDVVATRATLGGLDQGSSQVSSMRTQVGQQANALIMASNAARIDHAQGEINAGNLSDVDLSTAATRLALAQRAVEASMSAATKTFSMTLLNQMK